MSRLNEKNKREREKAEELRKKNYKIPEWTSSRPKPFFDPTIWPDQETTDKMAVYTDWHGRHPHMVTPRPLEDVLVLTGKNIQVASPRTQAMTYTSEEDKEAIADTGMPKTKGEQLVSYGNGLHAPPLPAEFTAAQVGARGKFAQVAKVSYKFERESVLLARYDSEDPWYKMSVKDFLETYHIDGDHTSVKLQPPKQRPKSLAQRQFEADAKWKAEQYGKYQGGGPNMSEEQLAILEKIIVKQTTRDRGVPISPWADTYSWTEYNKSGTLLDDFNQVDQERRIKYALECHEELLKSDEIRKIEAKKARLAEKRRLLGLATPQSSKPNTAALSKPGTGKIHPMETVAEGAENGDLIVQNIEDESALGDGDNSVSSIGGNTYQLSLDGGGSVLPGSYGGDGDSAQVPSLTSGSTYRHRTHGDDISQLNFGSGASQDGVQVVDEMTLQAALEMAEKDTADEVSAMTGAANTKGDSIAGKRTRAHNSYDSPGKDTASAAGDQSLDDSLDTKPSKRSNRKSKLDEILKSKGLSKVKSTGGAETSQPNIAAPSRARRMMSLILGAPLLPFAALYRKLRRSKTDEEERSAKAAAELAAKARQNDVDLSDDEEEEKKAPVEDDLLDKYDLMTKKLGGAEELERQAEAWEKFAALVRKQTKRETNMLDTTMDLPDAVEKCNLAKVVFLLAVGDNDPNMRANNDEPILINVIGKIIIQDTLTGSLIDDTNESPDRVKLFRVLQALVKFNVNINTTEAKNGIPPLHMAVAAGNIKLVNYLLECGADINMFSNPPAGDQVGTTVLMQAGRLGNIDLMARLIRKGAGMTITDDRGRNVLHYTAMYGQTRAALFLLRCGHDKRLKDKNKQTAGSLADELGFTVTAQAIMTYAVLGYKAQFALEYFTEKARLAAIPKSAADQAVAAAAAAFKNAAEAFSNAAEAGKDALLNAGKWLLRAFGCMSKPQEVEKIDANKAFNMDSADQEQAVSDGRGDEEED